MVTPTLEVNQTIPVLPRDIVENFLFKYNEVYSLEDFIQKLSHTPLYNTTTEEAFYEKERIINIINEKEHISDIVFSCLSHFSDIEDNIIMYIRNYDIMEVYIELLEYLQGVSYIILNKRTDLYQNIVKVFGYISVVLYDLYEQNRKIKKFYDKINHDLFIKALETEYIRMNRDSFISKFRLKITRENKKQIGYILRKARVNNLDISRITENFLNSLNLHPVIIRSFVSQAKKMFISHNYDSKFLDIFIKPNELEVIREIETYIYI